MWIFYIFWIFNLPYIATVYYMYATKFNFKVCRPCFRMTRKFLYCKYQLTLCLRSFKANIGSQFTACILMDIVMNFNKRHLWINNKQYTYKHRELCRCHWAHWVNLYHSHFGCGVQPHQMTSLLTTWHLCTSPAWAWRCWHVSQQTLSTGSRKTSTHDRHTTLSCSADPTKWQPFFSWWVITIIIIIIIIIMIIIIIIIINKFIKHVYKTSL